MKMLKASLFIIIISLVTPGCLTSDQPFYFDTDVKADDHLLGTFRHGDEQANWSIEKDLDRSGHYFVTFASDVKPCTMRFSAALFQVGTNQFLDLLPIPEACDRVAGGPPSAIEIFQAVVFRPLHVVVRVESTINGLRCGLLDQQSLQAAVRNSPEYFQRLNPQQLPRMLPDTKHQREFLLLFGGNTNIFRMAELMRYGPAKK